MQSDSSWRIDVCRDGEVMREIDLEDMTADSFAEELLREAGFSEDAGGRVIPSANLYLNSDNVQYRIWIVRLQGKEGPIVRGVFCDNASPTR